MLDQMEPNEPGELGPARLTLRERLGRWLLHADRPVHPTVTQLQADFTQLRLEWADTVDFIQHWAGRQSKRDQKVLKQKLSEPEPDFPTEQGPVSAGALDKSELRRRANLLRTPGNGHHHLHGS